MKERTRKNGTPEFWTEKSTDKIKALESIVSNCQMAVIDGISVDMQSANAILVLYKGINDSNKEHYIKMSLGQMAKIAFKLCK